MPRPQQDEYGTFFERYILNTTGDDVVKELERSAVPLQNFLNSILEEKGGHRYAPGKWTIRQLIQHMIDTERVFAYRAMCIARGEDQPLPGFDENTYADAAPADNRSLQGLVSEMMMLRQASIALFRHISPEALMTKGIASNNPISVNALGFLIVGHALHHKNILEERYL